MNIEEGGKDRGIKNALDADWSENKNRNGAITEKYVSTNIGETLFRISLYFRSEDRVFY